MAPEEGEIWTLKKGEIWANTIKTPLLKRALLQLKHTNDGPSLISCLNWMYLSKCFREALTIIVLSLFLWLICNLLILLYLLCLSLISSWWLLLYLLCLSLISSWWLWSYSLCFCWIFLALARLYSLMVLAFLILYVLFFSLMEVAFLILYVLLVSKIFSFFKSSYLDP